jgi:hypothetical protein
MTLRNRVVTTAAFHNRPFANETKLKTGFLRNDGAFGRKLQSRALQESTGPHPGPVSRTGPEHDAPVNKIEAKKIKEDIIVNGVTSFCDPFTMYEKLPLWTLLVRYRLKVRDRIIDISVGVTGRRVSLEILRFSSAFHIFKRDSYGEELVGCLGCLSWCDKRCSYSELEKFVIDST